MGRGFLLEIPGEGGNEKADRLAEALSPVLTGRVVVSRPMRKGEVRLTGLDASVGPEDIVAAVTAGEFGPCRESDIAMGPIAEGRDRMGSAWLRCPEAVATKLAAVGRLRVGWSSARVVPLEVRRLQCYKCLEFGHVRQSCRNEVDRTRTCFRCGKDADHTARTCTAPVRCVLCDSRGLSTGHRMGGPSCPSRLKGRNGRRNPPERRIGVAAVAAEMEVDRNENA
ncbi:uncharacterized protein LOC109862090 [Pseudomyrmex gracilis]|uniref:uncharacterized protein LOC109862090 n=1 Tax=Pseudomyrmex gracilis TaxID=219809 RepID=UPI0009949C5E|nr:uncharacterized protein LOC109862090 [Pseudomyrmex gracilis]